MDIIEFADTTQIEVLRIFGGPRFINGYTRDTLSFEIDPSYLSLIEAKEIFQDTNKTNRIFVYEDDNKVEIAEGYCLYVSTRIENRVKQYPPGKVRIPEYEDIIVANIAQLTPDEYRHYLNGWWKQPEVI